jgi:adenine-specific DNA-methyltransferase
MLPTQTMATGAEGQARRRPKPDPDAPSPLPSADHRKAADDAKDTARRLAEIVAPRLRLGFAQKFCAATIEHYWSKLAAAQKSPLRAAPAVGGPARLDRAALAAAASLGIASAGLSVEAAAHVIGSTYAVMLPPELRSERGVFYTPPDVAERLLDLVTDAGLDWTNARVLDPACGGGAFLAPVARRMLPSLAACDRRVALRNLATRLRGYEIDPFAAWMSHVFVDATIVPVLGGPVNELELIEVTDSLTKHEGRDFDLVVGNPPYGRLVLPDTLRQTYERSLYGHANIYGVFLDVALRRVVAGGLVAHVTPTSVLGGEYFKRLRRLLLAESQALSVDFLSDRWGVFDDVLQETMLTVFRKTHDKPADSAPAVHFADLAVGGGLTVTGGCTVHLSQGDAPWVLPRAPSAVPFVDHLRRMPGRLKDWGYGVSTGPLVWNRYKSQLRRERAAGSVPLIWAESVSADGAFEFRSARRNHLPYFAIRRDDDWLLVRRPCVLLQRTTAKEQARRLIAAELPPTFIEEHGAVTVENHLNMVVPIVDNPAVDARTVAAFLNSAVVDRAFRCISGSVAVSAYELESMPVPDVASMRELQALGISGATRAEIDAQCAYLYSGTQR